MRQLARSYLQHGRRHGPQGSDPIPDLGGSVPQFCYASSFGASISATTQTLLSFDAFSNTDPDTFGTSTEASFPWTIDNTSGAYTIVLQKFGAYIYFASTVWETGAYSAAVLCQIQNGAVLSQNFPFGWNAIECLASMAALNGTPRQLYDVGVTYVDDTYNPGALNLQVENFDSASRSVNQGILAVAYLGGPNSDLNIVY